jgi:hypothetical protein
MPPSRPKTSIPSLRPRYAPPSGTALPIGPETPFHKRRAFVYTAGFAVITVAGTLIGATLKSREQAEEKKIVKQKVEADVGEQIVVLESTRGSLVQRKIMLEKKIREVRERQVKEEELKREKEVLRAKGDELKRQMALGRSRD